MVVPTFASAFASTFDNGTAPALHPRCTRCNRGSPPLRPAAPAARRCRCQRRVKLPPVRVRTKSSGSGARRGAIRIRETIRGVSQAAAAIYHIPRRSSAMRACRRRPRCRFFGFLGTPSPRHRCSRLERLSKPPTPSPRHRRLVADAVTALGHPPPSEADPYVLPRKWALQ